MRNYHYPFLKGGIDFDNTPRILLFPAGRMSSCATVEIFLDSFDEVVEQFSVTIISESDGVLISHSGDLVVTITDEGTIVLQYCLKLFFAMYRYILHIVTIIDESSIYNIIVMFEAFSILLSLLLSHSPRASCASTV